MKEGWSPPPTAVLQWDGKLMTTLDGASKEERLPVLVSGKLLGVPAIPKAEPLKAGEGIAKAAVGLVKQWKASEGIVAMCFDTTNINAGQRRNNC